MLLNCDRKRDRTMIITEADTRHDGRYIVIMIASKYSVLLEAFS